MTCPLPCRCVDLTNLPFALLQECCDTFLHLDAWHSALDAVCGALKGDTSSNGIPRGGSQSPCSLTGGIDAIPISGADSLVFLRHGLAIKFITEEVRNKRAYAAHRMHGSIVSSLASDSRLHSTSDSCLHSAPLTPLRQSLRVTTMGYFN